jgi:integrase
MASISKPSNGKTYNARVRIWSAQKQCFTWACWSTGETESTKAMQVAKAMQESADQLAPEQTKRNNAAHLKRVFESMCLRAGVEFTDGKHGPDFAIFAADWLRRRTERTKDSTAAAYSTAIDSFKSHIGSRTDMGKLTASDLQEYYDSMIEDGQSTGTAKSKFNVVAGIFKRAHELGSIQLNPAAPVEMRTVTQAERKPFTAEQEKQIFNYLTATHMTDWLTACMLARWAAMRLGDAISLTWRCIEWTNSQAVITYAPQKKTRRNGDGKKVVIPAIGPLSEYLKDLYVNHSPSFHLCPTLYNLPSKNVASTTFARILESAGIDRGLIERDGGNDFHALSFHSWRSTCISWLANAGVDKETRMLIANHDSEKVHAGYTHQNAVMLGERLKNLNNQAELRP